jgi:ankyrin repeat protein
MEFVAIGLFVIVIIAYLMRRGRSTTTTTATKDAREHRSPLGAALENGQDDVVRSLLKEGVDPNAAAKGDDPALFVAAAFGRTNVVAALVRAGAALDFVDPSVGSSLAAAIARGHVETANALIKAGVPMDLVSAGGARDMHYAALVGSTSLVQRLIDEGADVDAPNFQGGTPLRAAASKGHADVVTLLLEKGADPSVVDAFDKRPIDYARVEKHSGVVEILEKASPKPSTASARRRTFASLAHVLPVRDDATLRGVKQSIAQGATGVRAGASALEAPSMIAAVRSLLGPAFHVDFPSKADPDPRLPARDVETILWTYETDGALTKEATPALDAPPAELRTEIAKIAEHPYALGVWSELSAATAKKIEPKTKVSDVLAVMVHPPDAPPRIQPWDWYFRVQVAAALVASHWPDSSGVRAVKDIADGPADWANTAAVIALFDLARRSDDQRADVVDALLRTARQRPSPPGYQHAIRPAARALLDLDASDEVRDEVLALLVD